MVLSANEARFFRLRVLFFGACSLQNEVGDPQFFLAFLAKVDHYLSAWQVSKKSVRGSFWARTSLNVMTGHSTALVRKWKKLCRHMISS